MSTFLLLVRNNPQSKNLSPKQMEDVYAKYKQWVQKLNSGDHLIRAEKLKGGEGKVIRGTDGVVTDGPYSEAKEVVGGYWLIQANDYDQAVEFGMELPFGSGTLEIREIESQD